MEMRPSSFAQFQIACEWLKNLLGPYIFTVVNIKKRPAIPIVFHTAWARALSAIVIVFPLTIRMHVIAYISIQCKQIG
jgi:hypothetical protein